MATRRPFQLIANWKMNLSIAASESLALEFRDTLRSGNACEFLVAPSVSSFPSVARVLAGSSIQVGAQNVCWAPSGAFTGEVSCSEILGCGGTFALVGHSERRRLCGESPELAAHRALGALEAGIDVVFCIGESAQEREANEVEHVIRMQLGALGPVSENLAQKMSIAYEPVWAIGTGKVATPEIIEGVVVLIQRVWKEKTGVSCPPIIYGGSVTDKSIASIAAVPGITGALVGGASLSTKSFGTLAESVR